MSNADVAGPEASPLSQTDPDLIVRLPPGSRREREYIANVVLGRWLGLAIEFEEGPPGAIGLRIPGSGSPTISVPDLLLGQADGGWQARPPLVGLVSETSSVETLLASGDIRTRTVPLLFGASGAERTELGTRSLVHDVFGVAFFLLAACDDHLSRARDRYDRQIYAGSLLDLLGAIDEPIVDYLTDHLWLALKQSFPHLERRKSLYTVWATHDIDRMLSWMSISKQRTAHAVAADVLSRHEPMLAVRRVFARVGHPVALSGFDPYDTFTFLMDASESIGVRSSFFFLLGGPSPVDVTHDVRTKSAQRLFRNILDRGHEIGLHGTAAATTRPEILRQQVDELRSAVREVCPKGAVSGGRQHYLAWRSPETWRAWANAGLSYDSSMAFHERVGFRAGTCRPFPVYDLEKREQLPLEERPLIIMDGTLWYSMGLAGRAGIDRARELSLRCRESAGTLTLLWHNTSFTSRHARRWYLDMLSEVRP